MYRSANKQYSLIASLFFIFLFVILVWYEWSWLFAYMCSINVVTFVYYGFDKGISHTRITRIPERILHVLALIGGSPGALLGQHAFRHKTRKSSFQLVYWMIVLVQAAIIGWYTMNINNTL